MTKVNLNVNPSTRVNSYGQTVGALVNRCLDLKFVIIFFVKNKHGKCNPPVYLVEHFINCKCDGVLELKEIGFNRACRFVTKKQNKN